VDDRERALDFFGSVDTSDGCGLDSADVDRLAAEFAAVRREERDACAMVCDELKSSPVTCVDGDVAPFDDVYGGYQACEKCAAAIRAMNEGGSK
jgi:hypothetical protein